MSNQIKQEIKSQLKLTQMAFLASSQEHQPHVRPMTLIYYKDRFYFATGKSDAKTGQFVTNPLAEICLLNKDEKYTGYTRARGNMKLISDAEMRKDIYNNAGFLQNYWNEPSDPGFVLFEMDWQSVEYIRPGENLPTTFSW